MPTLFVVVPLVALAFSTALVGVTGRLPPPKGHVFPSIGIRSDAVCHDVETWRIGHLAAERRLLAGAALPAALALLVVLWPLAAATALAPALIAWFVLVVSGVRRADAAARRHVRRRDRPRARRADPPVGPGSRPEAGA